MIQKEIELNLPEGNFKADVIEFEEIDRKKLLEIYDSWRTLCTKLNEMQARSVNLPEGLSESSFCLEMNCFRTTGGVKKAGKIKVNTSFDAYNPISNKRIQVKACSVLPDLTSFGPKSVWDELYFVDFYRDGLWDGKFDIYKIETNDIYTNSVNAGQSFTDQQAQQRRPRFSIYSDIIKPKNIVPIKTGDLKI
ncbi:Bsp6I family type II restriction endonuclease [Aliarcobacter butzleri]|uniref:Bsp6I family type II restriction endonuclease n=1 Tax=Aliarcobacter butzleri TaxID=28197 RepID=UPI0021B394F6|nr:Bsp6I family type II restriction endonuclease [Aliarcobacter butzleri]MCT7646681.1 Bsp6I family type II restriction endonuclease [Aliarcobacter butzleri]